MENLILVRKVSKNIRIYVDAKNEEIIDFLLEENNFKTFKIFEYSILLENNKNKNIYEKESISKNCKNLYSLKFRKGKNQNDRIYTLEIISGKKKNIILAKLITKKTQSINKKIKQAVEGVCKNKYIGL